MGFDSADRAFDWIRDYLLEETDQCPHQPHRARDCVSPDHSRLAHADPRAQGLNIRCSIFQYSIVNKCYVDHRGCLRVGTCATPPPTDSLRSVGPVVMWISTESPQKAQICMHGGEPTIHRRPYLYLSSIAVFLIVTFETDQ